MYQKLLPKLALLFLLLSVMSSVTSAELKQEVKEGVTHLSQTEFVEKTQQENVVVIDVRTAKEYQNGHIEGAINLSHKDIIENVSLLDPYQGKDLVFYCHSGVRVNILTDYLRDVAFTSDRHLFHLKGDIRAWRARGKPLVK